MYLLVRKHMLVANSLRASAIRKDLLAAQALAPRHQLVVALVLMANDWLDYLTERAPKLAVFA